MSLKDNLAAVKADVHLASAVRPDDVVRPIEDAAWLDRIADRLSAVINKALPAGRRKDLLSGTALGHPLHPVLVGVPTGAWTGASVLDVVGGPGGRRAARTLVGLGLLTAAPTAAAGWSDWADTNGVERRVGLVHAASNAAAIGLYAASWLARRRKRELRGAVLSAAGAGLLSAGGYLGGHLAYAYGVGVDTTAFQDGPQEWVDVAGTPDVVPGTPTLVDAAGVPLLLVRQDGRIHALADRCTHRGAPLHEGELAGGCIVCPWHDSRFRLEDGAVEQGPATRPQPVYEVRDDGDRISVRRGENRALRTNPIGV